MVAVVGFSKNHNVAVFPGCEDGGPDPGGKQGSPACVAVNVLLMSDLLILRENRGLEQLGGRFLGGNMWTGSFCCAG